MVAELSTLKLVTFPWLITPPLSRICPRKTNRLYMLVHWCPHSPESDKYDTTVYCTAPLKPANWRYWQTQYMYQVRTETGKRRFSPRAPALYKTMSADLTAMSQRQNTRAFKQRMLTHTAAQYDAWPNRPTNAWWTGSHQLIACSVFLYALVALINNDSSIKSVSIIFLF